jgi:hypothetical protein
MDPPPKIVNANPEIKTPEFKFANKESLLTYH